MIPVTLLRERCLKKKPDEQFTYEYLPDIFLTTAIIIPARIPTATMIPIIIPTSAIVPRPPESRNWNVTMYLMETIDKRLLIDLVLFCCIPLLREILYCLVNSEVGLDVQQPAGIPLGSRAPCGCGYGNSEQVKEGKQLREQAVPPLKL